MTTTLYVLVVMGFGYRWVALWRVVGRIESGYCLGARRVWHQCQVSSRWGRLVSNGIHIEDRAVGGNAIGARGAGDFRISKKMAKLGSQRLIPLPPNLYGKIINNRKSTYFYHSFD